VRAVVSIEIDKIKVPDVRVSSILNDEQKAFMASTIQEIGVIQDIVVRDLGDRSYELVAGGQRLKELKAQGLKDAPCKVIKADERLGLIMNIVENVARGSFDYVSIAQSIRKLKALGAQSEELEKVFPWKKPWIDFIEQLQDLPEDVQEALRQRKITPSHVSVALHMPTAVEVHDALRTAIHLEWPASTLKTYVENRIREIEAAKQRAKSMGVEPEIPPANPQQLIQYKQCLICGYKKPSDAVTASLICTDCTALVQYIVNQVGPPEEAIKTVYLALKELLEPKPRGPLQPPPTDTAPSTE